MIRQTLALFIDAYRELNAKKLFWITLAISALVVGAVGAVGINERGWTMLWWTFDDATINSKVMKPVVFYRFVFATLAIPIWLTWAATILALVSTASIIPEFVSGGAIELSLSKPISRMRLILTKYLTGLTFAALQVGVFCVACFLVIGIRAGAWDASLFLAVPIVVLFFSYLYCFCALVGLVTRSTIASVLITIGFWVLIFLVHSGEQVFLTFKTTNELRQERLVAMIEALKAQREQSEQQAKADGREVDPAVLHVNETSMQRRQEQLDRTKADSKMLVRGHAIMYGVMTVLPKTKETVGLLNRYLLTTKEQEQFLGGDDMPAPGPRSQDDVRISQKQLMVRLEQERRSRTIFWVLGTSIGFEVALVGLLVWFFCRRDF
ncbi:MAG: ABC transporter permease [Phycisphaeraceae bacterium]|nr:ABC transporter permease [Phycisphaeraceae bacterium]